MDQSRKSVRIGRQTSRPRLSDYERYLEAFYRLAPDRPAFPVDEGGRHAYQAAEQAYVQEQLPRSVVDAVQAYNAERYAPYGDLDCDVYEPAHHVNR